MQRNKGISLIVLVITIIVMIILAGSIIITLSNSGIINKANEAVDLSNAKQLKEYVTSELIINGWYSGKVINKEEHLEGIEDVTITDIIEGDTWLLTKDAAKVTVYSTGDIVEGEVKPWDGTSVEVPEIKEGNWYIYTPAQFKFFAGYVNNVYEKDNNQTVTLTDDQMAKVPAITKETTVNLMADLDLGARQENGELKVGTAWTPIGPENTDTGKFMGTFDGNNHTIRGVYVSITNPDTKFVGIFGNSNTIKNLTVKDSYIEAENNCVGGIVGALREGDLINCYNINTEVIGKQRSVGGVVGQFGGNKIEDCHNINTNKIKGKNYCGGVAGYILNRKATLINCTNTGYIFTTQVSNDQSCTGGIVGLSLGAEINNCTNSGNVEGTGKVIGGIVGYSEVPTITNCINNGNVTTDTRCLGGIIGIQMAAGTITNCTNSGKILCESKNGVAISGICGYSAETVNINNCKNAGNIIAYGERVGGIIGHTNVGGNKITNCVNTSQIQSNKGIVGGIAGSILGTVEKCYNTGVVKLIGENLMGIGGIAGATLYISSGSLGTSAICNTYNTGTIIVEGNNNKHIAGIVGVLSTGNVNVTVNNNYNVGRIQITGTGANEISGIASKETNEDGTLNISNNYYLQGITTATLNDIGEAKPSAEMKTSDFLKDLNTGLAAEVWVIRTGENSGYPVLK